MVEKGTYKGKPTISLKKDAEDRFAFTFGEEKARRILEHFEEIKAFVAECDAAKGKK